MFFWNFFKNNTLGLFQNEIRTIDDWIGWIKIGQPNAQTRKLNRSKNYSGRTFIGCWMQRWYQGTIREGAQKPHIWQITGLHRLLFMRSIRVPSIIITQRTFLSLPLWKCQLEKVKGLGLVFCGFQGTPIQSVESGTITTFHFYNCRSATVYRYFEIWTVEDVKLIFNGSSILLCYRILIFSQLQWRWHLELALTSTTQCKVFTSCRVWTGTLVNWLVSGTFAETH